MQSTADQVLSALASYAVKGSKQRGVYYANSPLRPGSNSHAFKLTVAPDGEHGAYTDHVSGESGTLYQLAAHLGIALPEKATSTVSGPTRYETADAYAAAHGVPWSVYSAAGWRQTTYKGRSALVFPTTTGYRYRFLDGQKPKFMHASDYQACWYGLDVAVNLAIATGTPLVLCNGEPSVLAAQWRGIPATCITGSGEREIPATLLTDLQAVYQGPIIVALDTDKRGAAAAPQLVSQLTTAGYSAKAVALGGTVGFDLADFCALHNDEAHAKLLTLQDVAAPPRTWYDEQEINTIKPPRFLIDGVIVFAEVTVIYGPSDTGKTFLVMDMVMRAAQHYPVMYVAGEDQPGIAARKLAWQRHYQRTPNNQFRMWKGDISLFDADQVEGFIAENRRIHTKVIVFDTLSQCSIGADENSNTDMAMVMANANRIAHEVDAAVIVIHHTTKNENSFRGAGAIKGNTYGFLSMENEDETIKLECIRIKNTRPWPTRWYRLLTDIDTGLLDTKGDSITSCVIRPSKQVIRSERLSKMQVKVLEGIGIIAKSQGKASATEVMNYLDIRGGSFYKPLNILLERNFVQRKNGRGVSYSVTEEGKTYLRDMLRSDSLYSTDGDTTSDMFTVLTVHDAVRDNLVTFDNPVVTSRNFSSTSRLSERVPSETDGDTALQSGIALPDVPEPPQYRTVAGYDIEVTNGLLEVTESVHPVSNADIEVTNGLLRTSKEEVTNGLSEVTNPLRESGDIPHSNAVYTDDETKVTNGLSKVTSVVSNLPTAVAVEELLPSTATGKKGIDWNYLRRRLDAQDYTAMQTHCVLNRVSLEWVIDQLDRQHNSDELFPDSQ